MFQDDRSTFGSAHRLTVLASYFARRSFLSPFISVRGQLVCCPEIHFQAIHFGIWNVSRCYNQFPCHCSRDIPIKIHWRAAPIHRQLLTYFTDTLTQSSQLASAINTQGHQEQLLSLTYHNRDNYIWPARPIDGNYTQFQVEIPHDWIHENEYVYQNNCMIYRAAFKIFTTGYIGEQPQYITIIVSIDWFYGIFCSAANNINRRYTSVYSWNNPLLLFTVPAGFTDCCTSLFTATISNEYAKTTLSWQLLCACSTLTDDEFSFDDFLLRSTAQFVLQDGKLLHILLLISLLSFMLHRLSIVKNHTRTGSINFQDKELYSSPKSTFSSSN